MAVAPLASMSATFFSDNFSNGSTINSVTPAEPTANSTSYQTVSAKTWNPVPSVTGGNLQFGIAATSSGVVEIQALFATNAIALTQVGDYIQMTVVFTNTSGLLTAANTFMGFGLYNSEQVSPFAGGLNGTAVNSQNASATGGVQNWKGYVGQVSYSGQNSRIMTRAAQTGTDNRNQELISSGSGSQSYGNPGAATVGSTTNTAMILTAGSTYTEVLTIQLIGENTLGITNSFYSGNSTSGSLLAQFGGVAVDATYLTSGFDGFGIGWRETGNQPTVMDISAIVISGEVTTISTPPDITLQPVPVAVPNGGSAAFFVKAQGFNVTYQWNRFGTNLVNGGNISGATSDTLVISPAGLTDVASGANGYYVTVSGAGGFSVSSTTNSLSLVAAKDLTWTGSGGVWDLNISANWQNSGGNPATFNFGDSVTFNGGQPTGISLEGDYLSASSVTVEGNTGYSFAGTGSFAGPGNLIFTGSFLEIANANTYTGGTIISNETALLYLNNYNGLGSGPITFAKAGGMMEVVPTGSSSLGLQGDIVVADDFTIQFDGAGAFAGVMFGDLSGTPGKTLTLTPAPGNLGNSTNRYRVYGTDTVFDANLVLAGPSTTMAVYNGTVLAPYNSTGSQVYNGVISGNGGLVQRANGMTILNGANTYAGGTTPTTGAIGLGSDSVGNVTSGPIGTGPLFLAPELPNTTGNGQVFASGGARTIANPVQYPSATNNLTLIIGGTNNLTFTGSFTLNGNDSVGNQTNRIIQVTNTALTTFSGVISDNGQGFGLLKTGIGRLALSNTETYTGLTTVGDGTLLVNGQLGSGSVIVTNGVLGGSGTIPGAVTIQAAGTLAPGNEALGTLTINNSLTLLGSVFIEVNKSSSPSNDVISVTGALINNGTGIVTVSNLSTALVAGDRFQIFNKAVQNGNNLSIVGGGSTSVTWVNNLAVDGSISVASTVSQQPQITSTSVSNGNINIGGTNGTTGAAFFVLTSTNLALPLANWTPVLTNTFGAGGSFSVNIPVSGSEPAKFYLLQLP